MTNQDSNLEYELACMNSCDFGEARAAYRGAALLTTPSETVLDNLALAEEGERLEYRCSLVEKYPDSLPVLLDHVRRLLDLSNYNLAADRCGELLQRGVWSPDETILIRQLRLSAVVNGESWTPTSRSAFKNDFFNILAYMRNTSVGYDLGPWLAACLARLCTPKVIESLTEIRDALHGEIEDEYILNMLVICKIN
jgi:hypothetical protein